MEPLVPASALPLRAPSMARQKYNPVQDCYGSDSGKRGTSSKSPSTLCSRGSHGLPAQQSHVILFLVPLQVPLTYTHVMAKIIRGPQLIGTAADSRSTATVFHSSVLPKTGLAFSTSYQHVVLGRCSQQGRQPPTISSGC